MVVDCDYSGCTGKSRRFSCFYNFPRSDYACFRVSEDRRVNVASVPIICSNNCPTSKTMLVGLPISQRTLALLRNSRLVEIGLSVLVRDSFKRSVSPESCFRCDQHLDAFTLTIDQWYTVVGQLIARPFVVGIDA